MHRPLAGLLLAAAIAGHAALLAQAPPALQSETLFPLEHWHNHSPAIVEHPKGGLFVTWFHGSGERTADDVEVRGAWQVAGATAWTAPMVIADTPGYPDTNPTLFVDRRERLWLLWPTILANEWHTALMKYKVAATWTPGQAPAWETSEVLHISPGDRFASVTARETARLAESLPADPELRARAAERIAKMKTDAADKLTRRLGWMTRTHPIILPDGRIIVPLYSDGFSFSLMAISDDQGATWHASEPLVGAGNIQPALALRKDGTLVAFMRDNGPAPKRIQVSESKDRGDTWSTVTDTALHNPGTSVDVAVLKNGQWVLVYNDLERGRHSLAVSLSSDEGRTWPVTRHLERDEVADPASPEAGQYHYPSIIQTRDGRIHIAYSLFAPPARSARDAEGRAVRKTIKHVAFDEAWLRAAAPSSSVR